MTICVLLTCHNRRVKTETCLLSLKESLQSYNKKINIDDKIRIVIYLTDDGCSDGTADAARNVFPDKDVLHLLQGDGNLFWAGGMRFCWKEAMKRHTDWDYYLLLNDDTELLPNLFSELFEAEKYAETVFGKKGIVSGITCAIDNPTQLTYGGSIWKNRLLATATRLEPNGKPQLCSLTNANILLVPTEIVDRIGIFYEGYRHGNADYDYSNMARKAGFPVILTANFCGRCDKDHLNTNEIAKKVSSMTLAERKQYFNNPIHSGRDYIRFVSRVTPIRLPLVWIGYILNLYCPKLYYLISKKRK